MPDVYEGNRPYIFLSYAHADDNAVLPLIKALLAEGYRVWWDKGIELAEPFPNYIAKHVVGCECFVPLLSKASLSSPWCCKEIEFAVRFRKKILPVFLVDIELPLGLDFQIGSLQSLYRLGFDSDSAFYDELFRARAIDLCLTAEGAGRRGAKARNPQIKVMESQAKMQVIQTSGAYAAPVRLNGVPSFEPRSLLAEYSWAELKELSWAIAVVASDAEGLGIAKAYGLVDKDGQLRGDQKPLKLKDGRSANVRILGFRHDELADGGKAGISFEFANVLAKHQMNPDSSNKGGWEKSDMRKWLRTQFFSLLPDDLRSNIVDVKKKTNNVGWVRRENATSVVTETIDGLWLLCLSEVYGNAPSGWYSSATYDAEGTQYQLYADQGVTAENYAFCVKGGASSWWWLRSPLAGYSSWFCRVDSVGDWDRWNYADGEGGVSPGFCF